MNSVIVGIISGFIIHVVITSISHPVEKAVESSQEDKAFKFIFGSPAAVGVLAVLFVSWIIYGLGAKEFAVGLAQGSVYGFAASFIARPFQKKDTGKATSIIIDRYKTGEREFLYSKLEKANLSEVELCEANLSKANLQGANLKRANLKNVNLSEAKLIGTNLSEADLSKANLNKSNLMYADLNGANLSGANFTKASLYRANLQGVNLIEADLTEADLNGANLYNANVTDAQLRGVKRLSGVTMPDGTKK